MADEPGVVARWLTGKLVGDSQLSALVGGRIYPYKAPQGSAMPYLTWAFVAGEDVRVLGPARLWTNALYQILAYTNGLFADVRAVASRVDDLLSSASGSASGGYVYTCLRERALESVDDSQGVDYPRAGGEYRITVQAA